MTRTGITIEMRLEEVTTTIGRNVEDGNQHYGDCETQSKGRVIPNNSYG